MCNKAEVRVIQRPFEIKIDCPHCKHEINMLYDDFVDLMLNDYPEDWVGRIMECPNCEKDIEIEDYDWI